MDDPRGQRQFGAEGAGSAPDAEQVFRELRDVFAHGAHGSDAADPKSGGTHECLEFCPICRTADVLRATTPPEVREHWHGLQREMALLVRAALDAYLERSETRVRREAQVEDIPIE